MSGIIITWNTCAEDTFKVFRDELADMFGVDPQAFYIAHYARYIRDEFRARDLPNGAWVSINFRLRGGGGGKRARTTKDHDNTKDDVVEDMEKELSTLEYKMEVLIKSKPVLKIIEDVEKILSNINCDANSVMGMFSLMPRDTLVKIQSVIDSHSKPLNNTTITNAFFKAEFAELKKQEELINFTKDRLRMIVSLMLIKAFGNEQGDTQWNIIKNRIEDIKTRLDKHQGRIEALTEQRLAEQRARDSFAGAVSGGGATSKDNDDMHL